MPRTRTRLPSPNNASQLHATLDRCKVQWKEAELNWKIYIILYIILKMLSHLGRPHCACPAGRRMPATVSQNRLNTWRWKNSNWRQTAETATRATTREIHKRGVTREREYYKYCKWKISCNEINEPNAGKCFTCAVNFSKVFNQHTRAQTSL